MRGEVAEAEQQLPQSGQQPQVLGHARVDEPRHHHADEQADQHHQLLEADVLAAGAAGKRHALPNARIMIHQPLGGMQGQATEIEIHAREILYLKSRLNEIMAKHTGRPVSDVEKDTDRDNFMSAAESVNYGLVDAVLEKREVNAS